MSRLLLKPLIPVTLALALMVALVRAQPHDDSDLRSLLLPAEGCPAPCWQGVRPGITRLDAAIGMMEETDGLEAVDRPLRYSGEVSGAEMSIWLMAHPGTTAGNPTIEAVWLKLPEITLGEIQLALGQPDRVMTYHTSQNGYAPFVAAYSRYSLFVLVDMPACTLDQATLWNTSRYVEIVVGDWLAYSSDYYLSSTELDTNHWAHQLRGALRCDARGSQWVHSARVLRGPDAH
jgi:hypothetical protein